MKYEYQVRMQQRHLKAIVGALSFRQRLLGQAGHKGTSVQSDSHGKALT